MNDLLHEEIKTDQADKDLANKNMTNKNMANKNMTNEDMTNNTFSDEDLMDIALPNIKPDRRILKTKKAIYDALVRLMQKKSLNSITVTELSELADINRKTFYKYYSTVNDVLDEVIGELVNSLNDLINEMSKDYNILSPRTLFALLNTIMSDSDIMRGLFESDNGNLLFNKLQKTLQQTIVNELNANKIKTNVPPSQYQFIASYVSGGMVSAYYEWITSPKKTPLDEMTQTLTALIISGVRSLT